MSTFIEDLYLVASNESTPPTGPNGYTLIGYWDVDKGGGHGTGGTTGSYMMALYAKEQDISKISTSQRIGEIMLTSSNESLPVAPQAPAGQPAYTNIGYWDVDKGGAVGSNGTRGSYMTGFYVRNTIGIRGDEFYISDVFLTASDQDFPVLPDIGDGSSYHLMGYWDMDNGGGAGTGGTTKGSYMMGLFMQLSRYG